MKHENLILNKKRIFCFQKKSFFCFPKNTCYTTTPNWYYGALSSKNPLYPQFFDGYNFLVWCGGILFHMKRFTSPSQQKGEVGEKIALEYIENDGFTIIETNYTKKTGEIDIVATKQGILHFVEVKTLFNSYTDNVSHETKPYDPWQNVSREKLRRFGRTCELYIIEKGVSNETPWQIDVIAVTVSHETGKSHVEVLWNVII